MRVQLPLALDPDSEPEPDVAVVAGEARAFIEAHPASAALVVAVSDSTLAYDRLQKGAIYARAGIAEYWIANVNDHVLEVHREPAPMSDQPLGHHYRSVTRLTPAEDITPRAARAPIHVGDLLP